MSGTPPGAAGAPPASGGTADPSMEDILASIRRILSEEEAAAGPAPAPASPTAESDMLALETSMLVGEVPSPAGPLADADAPPSLPPVPEPPAGPAGGLVAPTAAAAAVSSVGTLVRALADRQAMAVHRGGPTLEDIVREEMRPMLKAWLDANLPELVERIVRTEIERVIGRTAT
jgi:cell pole-organizing protein PopZ